MTPKEAVAAAHFANHEWMNSHVGIVQFILSECDLENVGNDEYDNVILRNPTEARAEAKALDAEGETFQVQLSLTIPKAVWYGSYGDILNEAGVKEFLENALFISSHHLAVAVQSVAPQK